MIKHGIAYNYDLPWVLQVNKAQGAYVWDQYGKQYIDFTSGWNVANLGFNNPEITQAVIEQAKINHYAPMWTSEAIQERYAEELTRSLDSSLNTVCRATSGTEANEIAMKIARAATNRKKIIGFMNAYHGQSLATLALSYSEQAVGKIGPLPDQFIQLQFPKNINSLPQFYIDLEKTLENHDVAAIVLEACMVTGSGTTYVTEPDFLRTVRKLTKKYGTLMILDEVGTGFSRCGSLFAHELYQVVPDIMTLAKAISNGAAAMAAVVTNKDLLEPTLPYVNMTSTFGWTPIACAAALATLQIHQRDKVYEQARTKGQWLLEELSNQLATHPKVGAVQGIGLEIGISFVTNQEKQESDHAFAAEVVTQALKNGLHITCCSQNVIQLMPPLIIPESDLQEGVAMLIRSIEDADEKLGLIS
jgi:4-aminobutyrate aminotransferase-like enzyme